MKIIIARNKEFPFDSVVSTHSKSSVSNDNAQNFGSFPFLNISSVSGNALKYVKGSGNQLEFFRSEIKSIFLEISIYINQINLVEDISQNCALEVEINSHGNLTYDDLEKIIKTNLSFYPQFKLIRILLDQSEQDYINNMMALGTLASPAKVMHLGSHDLVASFLENKKFEEIHDAYMNSEIVRIDIECSHEITRQDVVAILGNDFPSECYGWYIDIYRQRNLFSLYINLKDIGNIKNLKGKERFNKFYELVSGSSLSSKIIAFLRKKVIPVSAIPFFMALRDFCDELVKRIEVNINSRISKINISVLVRLRFLEKLYPQKERFNIECEKTLRKYYRFLEDVFEGRLFVDGYFLYNVYCSLYANYTPSLEGQSNQFLINENNDTTEVVFVRKIKINFSDAANHLRRSYDILKDRIQEIPYLFEALDGVSYPDSGANYFKVVFNMKIGDPNTLMWRMAAILYEIGLDEFFAIAGIRYAKVQSLIQDESEVTDDEDEAKLNNETKIFIHKNAYNNASVQWKRFKDNVNLSSTEHGKREINSIQSSVAIGLFSHLHENGFNIKRDKIKDDEDRLEVKLKTKTGKEINQEIEKIYKKYRLPTEKHPYGIDLLMRCSMADNVKDLRLLLAYECKFDVNLTDDEGRTALHWAVIKDSISCIEFLLQNGARQDIPDRFKKTAKDYAAKSTNKDVLKLFNISEEDQVLVSLAFSGMKL